MTSRSAVAHGSANSVASVLVEAVDAVLLASVLLDARHHLLLGAAGLPRTFFEAGVTAIEGTHISTAFFARTGFGRIITAYVPCGLRGARGIAFGWRRRIE